LVGVHDELKGQMPVGFLVLKKGVDRDAEDICREVVQMVELLLAGCASLQMLHYLVVHLHRKLVGEVMVELRSNPLADCLVEIDTVHASCRPWLALLIP
jgi:hypothetical protein